MNRGANHLKKPSTAPYGKLNDQQILECRALKEYHRWRNAELAKRYDATPSAIHSICTYNTRQHLTPAGPLADPPTRP